jgi:hypothetical protein
MLQGADFRGFCFLTGNHLGCMQLLLQAGQDVNAPDMCLATPIHYACDRGCLEAVQLLLYAGGNVSSRDCYGRAPLHRAAVEALILKSPLYIDFYSVNILGHGLSRMTSM